MDNAKEGPCTKLFIKIILFMYWLFGFQTLKYSDNEISTKGLIRLVYPAIITSVYALYAGFRIKTRDDSASSMAILTIVDTLLEIVEASLIIASIILECLYADKKAHLYINLNQAYNEIYKSENFKTVAIKMILTAYLIYFVGSLSQAILSYMYTSIELGLLGYFIIITRNLSVDFMIMQIVVEIYFCTLGFYSLNESLCNFGRQNPCFSKRFQEIDFQTIDIYHKYYHIEWFEKTEKSKNEKNLQKILKVYNILSRCVDLVILRFGILVRKKYYYYLCNMECRRIFL